MNKIELEIKEFSTKKLKDIVEVQYNAYNEAFIDYAKNELIRRGEVFAHDSKLEEQISSCSDGDLKEIVEKERGYYHLEYLELAIKEYLLRGFKNETGYDEIENEEVHVITLEKRYPFLKFAIQIYVICAFICFCGGLFLLFIYVPILIRPLKWLFIFFCAGAGISALVFSEAIKVYLAIEENTRLAVAIASSKDK